MSVNANEAVSEFDASTAARLYLTPKGRRKIVRLAQVDEPCKIQEIPFQSGHLAMRSWGQGAAVLLVHGWSGCQSDMFGLVPYIVARGFRAVTVDLPAHGESSGETLTIDESAEAVLQARNSIDNLHGIIAHSFGCAATGLAISRGMRVGKVVFLAPPESYEGFARAWARSQDYDLGQTDRVIETLRNEGITINARTSELVKTFDLEGMILFSTDDEITPAKTGRQIAAAWTNSKCVEVDGLGHRKAFEGCDRGEHCLRFHLYLAKVRSKTFMLIVEEASESDKQIVVDITLAAYAEYEKDSAPGFWKRYCENIKQAILDNPAVTVLVAKEEGQIKASVLYCAPNSGTIPNEHPEMRLLAVPTESRNQGLANLLIEECERRATAGGVLTLHTTALMTTAKAMYERRGYLPYPSIDFEPVPGFMVWGYKKDLKTRVTNMPILATEV